jgi:hypothetical protein
LGLKIAEADVIRADGAGERKTAKMKFLWAVARKGDREALRSD